MLSSYPLHFCFATIPFDVSNDVYCAYYILIDQHLVVHLFLLKQIIIIQEIKICPSAAKAEGQLYCHSRITNLYPSYFFSTVIYFITNLGSTVYYCNSSILFRSHDLVQQSPMCQARQSLPNWPTIYKFAFSKLYFDSRPYVPKAE